MVVQNWFPQTDIFFFFSSTQAAVSWRPDLTSWTIGNAWISWRTLSKGLHEHYRPPYFNALVVYLGCLYISTTSLKTSSVESLNTSYWMYELIHTQTPRPLAVGPRVLFRTAAHAKFFAKFPPKSVTLITREQSFHYWRTKWRTFLSL